MPIKTTTKKKKKMANYRIQNNGLSSKNLYIKLDKYASYFLIREVRRMAFPYKPTARNNPIRGTC